MDKRFIVTNFAYGTGPYLHTTKLALDFNRALENAGRRRFGILVPLVYGDRQKKIMAEAFGEYVNNGEIVLDEKLGAILREAFYENSRYKDYLKKWIETVQEISTQAKKYLADKNIAVELARSPRISYGIAPAYYSSFAYTEEILKAVGMNKAAEMANKIEKNYKIHAIAYPGTFSWESSYKQKYPDEILVPPLGLIPKPNAEKIEPSIYVTKTGISGLERLYQDADKFGLRIYSNDTHLPEIISNKNIQFHFARSGWGSVWLSLLAGTPLIVPEYISEDDPEIFLNNQMIERLGIGMVYRGENFENILTNCEKIKANQKKLRDNILGRWGTVDGMVLAAKIFAKDFLSKKPL